jgi:hypothetical protein
MKKSINDFLQSDIQYKLFSTKNAELKSAKINFWKGHLRLTRLQNETAGEGMAVKESIVHGIENKML